MPKKIVIYKGQPWEVSPHSKGATLALQCAGCPVSTGTHEHTQEVTKRLLASLDRQVQAEPNLPPPAGALVRADVADLFKVSTATTYGWSKESKPGGLLADNPFPAPDGSGGPGRKQWWAAERVPELVAWNARRLCLPADDATDDEDESVLVVFVDGAVTFPPQDVALIRRVLTDGGSRNRSYSAAGQCVDLARRLNVAFVDVVDDDNNPVAPPWQLQAP